MIRKENSDSMKDRKVTNVQIDKYPKSHSYVHDHAKQIEEAIKELEELVEQTSGNKKDSK